VHLFDIVLAAFVIFFLFSFSM